MSDPFNEAWMEAEASAPPGVEKYAGIELVHPAFLSDGDFFAVRAVAGSPISLNLTLEDGAPLNSGETVEFQAIPFNAQLPPIEEGKTPECAITIDNVSREIMPYLDAAVAMRADMIMRYREWLSDDTTSPCYGPVEFVIKRVKVSGTRITGFARIDDLANTKFPGLVYTYTKYKGLKS
jgi:hypothetical protein